MKPILPKGVITVKSVDQRCKNVINLSEGTTVLVISNNNNQQRNLVINNNFATCPPQNKSVIPIQLLQNVENDNCNNVSSKSNIKTDEICKKIIIKCNSNMLQKNCKSSEIKLNSQVNIASSSQNIETDLNTCDKLESQSNHLQSSTILVENSEASNFLSSNETIFQLHNVNPPPSYKDHVGYTSTNASKNTKFADLPPSYSQSNSIDNTIGNKLYLPPEQSYLTQGQFSIYNQPHIQSDFHIIEDNNASQEITRKYDQLNEDSKYINYNEQPQDYSNNTTVKDDNAKCIEFINNIINFSNEDINEKSYIERKKAADDVLSSTSSEMERKKALEINFGLIVDEPLEECIIRPEDIDRSTERFNSSLKRKPLTDCVCHWDFVLNATLPCPSRFCIF